MKTFNLSLFESKQGLSISRNKKLEEIKIRLSDLTLNIYRDKETGNLYLPSNLEISFSDFKNIAESLD